MKEKKKNIDDLILTVLKIDFIFFFNNKMVSVKRCSVTLILHHRVFAIFLDIGYDDQWHCINNLIFQNQMKVLMVVVTLIGNDDPEAIPFDLNLLTALALIYMLVHHLSTLVSNDCTNISDIYHELC